jgi:hypothetical protein
LHGFDGIVQASIIKAYPLLSDRNAGRLITNCDFREKTEKNERNEPVLCQRGGRFVSAAAGLSARRPVCQHSGRFVSTAAGLSARP